MPGRAHKKRWAVGVGWALPDVVEGETVGLVGVLTADAHGRVDGALGHRGDVCTTAAALCCLGADDPPRRPTHARLHRANLTAIGTSALPSVVSSRVSSCSHHHTGPRCRASCRRNRHAFTALYDDLRLQAGRDSFQPQSEQCVRVLGPRTTMTPMKQQSYPFTEVFGGLPGTRKLKNKGSS